MSALNLKKNHKKHKKASTNAYFEGNQTPKLLVGETQKGTSKVGKFSMRKRIQKFDSTRELQQVAHGNEEEKEI
ncbi:hypothetical protein FGO68_gene17079 [Halteria grandinella]|uniref:Uncharacterized protein n=1 Tax=Halteria grandinella TaxID=5974 RepID=A0A8J8P2V2_HALGN|nr:hypothetical protein FGO68_gene17079 [Halteria grandinella]